MRHPIVLILAAGLLLGFVQAAQAVETQSVTLTLTAKMDVALEADIVEMDLPATLQIAEGAELTSAYLELHAALDPGQEVELWQDTGTQDKPWADYENHGLRKAHWVADARTGSLVRLDVTGLPAGWLAGTETAPKLLIRLAPDGEDVVSDFTPLGSATATLVIRTR